MRNPTYDPTEFITSFLVNGAYVFDAWEILCKFPIEHFPSMKDGSRHFKTSEARERLEGYDKFQRDLIQELLQRLTDHFDDFAPELRFNDMWNNQGTEVDIWHSDLNRAWPGFNASVNCYFDDSNELIGGALQSHMAEPNIAEDSPGIFSVYPRKFSIAVINQTAQFVHRALIRPGHQRRMFSFAARFPNINPVY